MRRGHRGGDLAGEPRQIVLHGLEFRDRPLEGDALIRIAHGEIEHRLQRASGLYAAHHAAHQHQHGLIDVGARNSNRLHLVERDGVLRFAREIDAIAQPACAGLDQRDR